MANGDIPIPKQPTVNRTAHPDHEKVIGITVPEKPNYYAGKPITGPYSKEVGNGHDTPRYHISGVDLDSVSTTGWRATVLSYKLQALTYGILIIGLSSHVAYAVTRKLYELFLRPWLRILGIVHKPVDLHSTYQGNGTIQQPYGQAIIGSGYSGLGLAIKLKLRGYNNFTILERHNGVGGTWRMANFPGACCDVPSNLYSFSFEQNPHWTRFWPTAPEIKSYIEHCAHKYNIVPKHIIYSFNVNGAEWLEDKQLWKITSDNNDTIYANTLVNGQGFLSDPKIPNIPGLKDKFTGQYWHSQYYNNDIDLQGKRVAVIGTGASALQIVPSIQPKVKSLVHFQRSAWWVRPRLGGENFEISEKWKKRYRQYPITQKLVRLLCYWLGEGLFPVFTSYRIFNRLLAEESIQYIYSVTQDKALRRKLIPQHEFGCRRMLLSSEFYPALTKPNVEVVQSSLVRVTENAVVDKDGKEYEVDVIILCTGYHTQKQENNYPTLNIIGRDSTKLTDVWRETMIAYKGTTIPKFPNYFVILGPNTNVAAISVTYMGEAQHSYIIDALERLKGQNLSSVDVKQSALISWNNYIQNGLKHRVWQTGGCYSWYQDSKSGNNTIMWPYFNFQYMWHVESFDENQYITTKRPKGVPSV